MPTTEIEVFMLLFFDAPCQLQSLAGQEHGRTSAATAIPAGDPPTEESSRFVVIFSNGEGDRSVGSLEVKVLEGWTLVKVCTKPRTK
jgi:hypothetical protein